MLPLGMCHQCTPSLTNESISGTQCSNLTDNEIETRLLGTFFQIAVSVLLVIVLKWICIAAYRNCTSDLKNSSGVEINISAKIISSDHENNITVKDRLKSSIVRQELEHFPVLKKYENEDQGCRTDLREAAIILDTNPTSSPMPSIQHRNIKDEDQQCESENKAMWSNARCSGCVEKHTDTMNPQFLKPFFASCGPNSDWSNATCTSRFAHSNNFDKNSTTKMSARLPEEGYFSKTGDSNDTGDVDPLVYMDTSQKKKNAKEIIARAKNTGDVTDPQECMDEDVTKSQDPEESMDEDVTESQDPEESMDEDVTESQDPEESMDEDVTKSQDPEEGIDEDCARWLVNPTPVSHPNSMGQMVL